MHGLTGLIERLVRGEQNLHRLRQLDRLRDVSSPSGGLHVYREFVSAGGGGGRVETGVECADPVCTARV